MPPKTALSTPLRAWRCPSCTYRSFTSTTRQSALGPEHPRYIPIREPPQQGNPPPKFIKGRLPVPRNIFSKGTSSEDKGTDAWLARVTQEPTKETPIKPAHNSREEWKASLSAIRRQNLREGVKSLHARKARIESRNAEKQARRQLQREEILYAPEREEDRLATPSHGLDLENLLNGGKLPDPTRQARLEFKKANYERHVARKREERFEHVNRLYHHAKDFIVTQQQLEFKIDAAFGADDIEGDFGGAGILGGGGPVVGNIWDKGRPDSIGQMLARTVHRPGRVATANLDSTPLPQEISKRRMKRIAEVLTGGKLDDEDDDSGVRKGW